CSLARCTRVVVMAAVSMEVTEKSPGRSGEGDRAGEGHSGASGLRRDARRPADDELGKEQHLRLRRGLPGDLAQQGRDGRLAHRAYGLAQGRERRVGEGDEGGVVVADDGDLAGDAEPALTSRADGA